MAPSSDRITQRIRDRIERSDYTMTVFYSEVRAKPTGTPPLSAGAVSLLMPTATPTATPPEPPEGVLPSVTLKCLFTDASTMTDYKQNRLKTDNGTWSRDTTAYARCLVEDVEMAGGGLIFDGCKWVEVNGKKFTVLHATRIAVSSEQKGTYYVYLAGGVKS